MNSYAIWNNKGGVGKTFLSFVLCTEFAKHHPEQRVIAVDMCPQANLSEILLGGNGIGGKNLEAILNEKERRTAGGYFDRRISSPHSKTGHESSYLIKATDYNSKLPDNLFLICGDPSLEIQAQVISQISGQTLPVEAWKNVHEWLKDLIDTNVERQGDTTVFIDCNPSFSAYTELAMVASDRLIVPCSSDGSSARAIDNLGVLLYGVGVNAVLKEVGFHAKAKRFGLPLPLIHSVILNRSTQYNKKASKAFSAMFDNIKERVERLRQKSPTSFAAGDFSYEDMPDSHSVTIVCSHEGLPLSKVKVGKYEIYDIEAQVNQEPLERYQQAVEKLLKTI